MATLVSAPYDRLRGERPVMSRHNWEWETTSMSEYQYYEFLALDRPLTQKQRGELRSISTRVEITATRFVNEYQ
jgi:hypothetical protein